MTVLPGHLPQRGTVEITQDKPEDVDRWYLSRKDIEDNSPSRRDGIDLKKETYLRKSYCTFLQDLGMRLKVPQVTIATSIIFSHRFFLHQSHAKNDRRIIATVCMFLAAKVEETPRPLKDVILVSYEIINKKDPAAVQKIKQKEVYEQQKELILFGERVVLATLGFDFNIHHPYKPLVEAIKKFQVAQNSLAQVAWNFVNDGLRTSLCLQFKPHHIAAGAIFLAAKFLKVKLPSDGEKVWWQEFDVTPRQLEEVSNQMLELYEQNRLPAPQGSEAEGHTGRVGSHQAPLKPPTANEESVSVKCNSQAGGVSSVIPGPAVPSSTRLGLNQSNANSQGGTRKSSPNRSNEYRTTEARDRGLDNRHKDGRISGPESLLRSRDNAVDALNGSKVESEHLLKNHERNNCESDLIKLEEPEKENASCKLGSTGQILKHRDPLCQSPQNGIKNIDKGKFKAALEKRRKSRGDVARKVNVMDDDDLIERELEDGIELVVEDVKTKQERKQDWSKSSNWSDVGNPTHRTDTNAASGDNYLETGEHGLRRINAAAADNVEEGEMPFSDKPERFHSPKSSIRRRKAESLDEHLEGNQHQDCLPGGHSNNHDTAGDKLKIGHIGGYTERDHKRRHVQENVV